MIFIVEEDRKGRGPGFGDCTGGQRRDTSGGREPAGRAGPEPGG